MVCGKEKLIHMGGCGGGSAVILLLDLEKLVVNQCLALFFFPFFSNSSRESKPDIRNYFITIF